MPLHLTRPVVQSVLSERRATALFIMEYLHSLHTAKQAAGKHALPCVQNSHRTLLLLLALPQAAGREAGRAGAAAGGASKAAEVGFLFLCIPALLLPCLSPHRCAVLVLCSCFSEQPACHPFCLLCIKGKVCQGGRAKSL